MTDTVWDIGGLQAGGPGTPVPSPVTEGSRFNLSLFPYLQSVKKLHVLPFPSFCGEEEISESSRIEPWFKCEVLFCYHHFSPSWM